MICSQLWDVCSDQDAVDLVRREQDPQAASKILVDHALSRFSTDNLSCMIVRFNSRGLQDAASKTQEHIGVDGDPPSNLKGGIRETEAIVGAAKKGMSNDQVAGEGEDLSRISTDMIQEEENAEPGPELDPEGLAKAKEKAKEGQQAVKEVSSDEKAGPGGGASS